MRSLDKKKRKDTRTTGFTINFENVRTNNAVINKNFKKLGNTCQEIYKNNSFALSELSSLAGHSKVAKCFKQPCVKSHIDSENRTEKSNSFCTYVTSTENQLNSIKTAKPFCLNTDHTKENCLRGTTVVRRLKNCVESSESFVNVTNDTKRQTILREKCKSPTNIVSSSFKSLRLFDRNGKPLTDRMGRPLLNIFGEPLVNIDNEGRLISDDKGHQVFNTLGESAIFSTTNLHLLPSGEELGIPILDIDKKHILFLFDNKGHPLTDFLGRPLVRASGNLMFGIRPKEKLNLNNYKQHKFKTMYSKAPLENFVRRVQIFDSSMKPLTDENGKPVGKSNIICNEHGMPLCDDVGGPLFYKYGTRINALKGSGVEFKPKPVRTISDNCLENSVESFEKTIMKNESCISLKEYFLYGVANSKKDNLEEDDNKNKNILQPGHLVLDNATSPIFKTSDHLTVYSCASNNEIQAVNGNSNSANIDFETITSTVPPFKSNNSTISLAKTTSDIIKYSCDNQKEIYEISNNNNNELVSLRKALAEHGKNLTGEAVVLYDGIKNIRSQKSSLNSIVVNDINNGRIFCSFTKKIPYKNMFRSNFFNYLKSAINKTNAKCSNSCNRIAFNDFGKPMRDLYGNLLYDKYGIPLTGADGIKLSEKVRQTLRLKLRNIPIITKEKEAERGVLTNSVTYNKSCDRYGDPYFDKHGRPLYDFYGKLIYDIYGRPLTDAFNRPLIDAIGQPLMDSKGRVLTSDSNPSKNSLVDVFGRYLYDKRGRALFDSYGRPRFDVFTNAIYDICGRPSTDGNGNILYDFLGKPIQAYPEKPLIKNSRALLPKFIDRILQTPSLHSVLKYSKASLKDVFGGPLFDDFGRPLYNRIGKPLHDKFGRPLYDKDGNPLCDYYGRPLSEEIRLSPDDTTLSVLDSLKLLKLTKESSMWMEIKRNQSQPLKQTESGLLDDAIVMKIGNPTKNKTTQYIYALTRVTTFTCGRQALEVLEAPLSPATAKEMHHLPMDNKPLIMVARRRKRISRRHTIKHH